MKTSNDPNALYLEIFNQYLKKKNIALETELELWSIESIKQSVISNLGIAYLPMFTIESEMNSGQMIKMNADINNQQITAIYAYKKSKWLSPAMKLFIQLIEATAL